MSKMHRLTTDGENTLQVDLGDCENNTAGDSLNYHNIMRFSTKDKDHDNHQDWNCAPGAQGGWWFGACYTSHLSGPYVPVGNTLGWYYMV